jgi:hypothetical protein
VALTVEGKSRKEGVGFEIRILKDICILYVYIYVQEWRHAAIQSMSMQATISIARQFGFASFYLI